MTAARIYHSAVTLIILLPSMVLAQSAATAPTAAPAAEATSAATSMSLAKAPRVSPRSLRFGGQLFATSAQTSAVRNVTILLPYTGAPVSLASAPSLSGANPTDFVVAQNQCPVNPAPPLAPGNKCSVGISFSPTGLGKRTAELSLAFAGSAPVTVKLFGTGVSPRISVSPLAFKFANTTVGQSSTSALVTVSNPSPVAVKILGVGLTGPFVADSSGCTTIAAGATCAVGVVFRPVAEGKATGLLTVHVNARGRGYTVDLSGTASKAP